LVEPWAEEDAALFLRVCAERGLPYRLLGGGSNVLIPDEGVDAFVFSIPQWNRVVRDGNRLIASAGATLPSLIRKAKDLALEGLETLVGIPAQVGGAVRMNAGTKEGETFDHLVSVRVADESGEIREIPKEDLRPRYRDGNLGRVLITTASFELKPSNRLLIQERIKEYLTYRNRSQPVTERSLGCIFKNPEGDAAGRLIEASGMKGCREGDIMVSEKHANYFVNLGEGTAAQVLELMGRVQEAVHREFALSLRPEIRIWGKEPREGE
jgi:UDP-N-acetylmuramate dehydrogenase